MLTLNAGFGMTNGRLNEATTVKVLVAVGDMTENE